MFQALTLGLLQHHYGPAKTIALAFRRLKRVALVILSAIIVALIVWLLALQTFPHQQEWQPSLPYAGPRSALVEDALHGLLPLREAQELCEKRRWEPYATRDQRRKICDLFLIDTELDFLEVRLNELDKEVDYFVILEPSTTFQTHPKPLHFQDNKSRFNDFQHKIIHRVLDDSGARMIPKDDTWEHERYTQYVSCSITFL